MVIGVLPSYCTPKKKMVACFVAARVGMVLPVPYGAVRYVLPYSSSGSLPEP